MQQEYGVFVTQDGTSWGMYFKGTSAYQSAIKNRVLLFHFSRNAEDAILWDRFSDITRLLSKTFQK